MQARTLAGGIATAIVLSTGLVSAQSADPMTTGAKTQLRLIQSWIIRTADKVPEEAYAFRPTKDVRSLGEILGHVADDLRLMCTEAKGEKAPPETIEKSVHGKPELRNALTESVAFCNQVLAEMDDRTGAELVPFRLGPTPKLSVVYFAVAHAYEHYGNLVTYMRMQNIVPPSSEPAPQRR